MNPILKEMRDVIKENAKLKEEIKHLKENSVSQASVRKMQKRIAELENQLGEAHEITAPIPQHKTTKEIIAPYIEKLGYKSTARPTAAYVRVYKVMEVDWRQIMMDYAAANNGSTLRTKANIVDSNPVLLAEFERAVTILLAE